MEFTAFVPESRMLRTYVNVINSVLELTEREKDVLIILIQLDMNWDRDSKKNIIDRLSRKHIMSNTYINRHNLSKYIRKFKDKKVLIETEEKHWGIDKNILPILINDGEINVNFILKTK